MNILRYYFSSDHYNSRLKSKFPHLADQILTTLALNTRNPALIVQGLKAVHAIYREPADLIHIQSDKVPLLQSLATEYRSIVM